MTISTEEIYDGPLYEAAKKVYPQKVWGTYRRIKWIVLWIALGVYYILPFIRWNRGPNAPNQAVLVDIAHSRFYAFFIELWPQEVYYFTGLLILAALVLFLSNALFGRVWCGYACPQTVWTDLFLWVERLIEGDGVSASSSTPRPGTADKIVKRVAKHAAWLVIAMLTGGAAMLYFEDAPTLLKDIVTFKAPFVAYLWVGIFTFTTYSLAGHMREQVCLYMCPWPRIQAALTDNDALNVTYRFDRGEPRMSVKDAAKAHAHGQAAGDCIDCLQCVAVCPTGVDIRKGSQLGCIQCGLCIDACDAVMDQESIVRCVSSPTTPMRIASAASGAKRMSIALFAPRTILYAAVIALTGVVMLYALLTRTSSHVSVLHVRAPLFTQTAQGGVRNGYTLRFSNKLSEPARLHARGQRRQGRDDDQRRGEADRRRPAQRSPRSRCDARGSSLCHERPRMRSSANRRRSSSSRPTRRRASSVVVATISSAHDRKTENGPIMNAEADRTTRPRHARRVLLRDVRRERRADLFRPAHAAWVRTRKSLRREPGLQPPDRRGARAGRAGMDRQRDDPGGRAGRAGHGRVPRPRPARRFPTFRSRRASSIRSTPSKDRQATSLPTVWTMKGSQRRSGRAAGRW